MKTVLIVLVILGLAGTLGVLLAGVFGLARGNDPRRSNELMRWRVIMQALTLLLLFLLMALLRS